MSNSPKVDKNNNEINFEMWTNIESSYYLTIAITRKYSEEICSTYLLLIYYFLVFPNWSQKIIHVFNVILLIAMLISYQYPL